jgi:hypothetical protein
MTADDVRARIKSKRKELVDLIATIDEAALSAPATPVGRSRITSSTSARGSTGCSRCSSAATG